MRQAVSGRPKCWVRQQAAARRTAGIYDGHVEISVVPSGWQSALRDVWSAYLLIFGRGKRSHLPNRSGPVNARLAAESAWGGRQRRGGLALVSVAVSKAFDFASVDAVSLLLAW